jgi:ubiquitin carboxyl-terminal hydrolase L3
MLCKYETCKYKNCLKYIRIIFKVFNDIYGFDPELLMMVPQPCIGVILLFPITEKIEKFRLEEEESLKDSERPKNVFWLKQTIGNACGTIGIIHTIANCRDKGIQIDEKSSIGKFFADCGATGEISGEEIGKLLEQNETIAKIHDTTSTSNENQTNAPQAQQKVNDHFVALVNVDNKLYELDGRKNRPICHGSTDADNFLTDAANVCKLFMGRDPTETKFAAVALSKDF